MKKEVISGQWLVIRKKIYPLTTKYYPLSTFLRSSWLIILILFLGCNANNGREITDRTGKTVTIKNQINRMSPPRRRIRKLLPIWDKRINLSLSTATRRMLRGFPKD